MSMEPSSPGTPPLGLFDTRDAFEDLPPPPSPTRLLLSLVETLKPAILQRRSHPHPVKATAWLDGLRGWAAFSVICLHLNVYTHPYIEQCYNSPMDSDSERLTTPGAWPFLRLFFSGGHFAVMLFFIISGYVVPMRLLSLLHSGRSTEFIEAANSAVVRRPLRLLLPVIWSTLFFACLWHVFSIATPWPRREESLFWELIAWARETGKFLDFYRMGFLFTYYNIHTWTIPIELRGSMYLFTWLFALHRVDNKVRISMQVPMLLYLSLGAPAAWYACFFAGMLTAELDMLGNIGTATVIDFPWDGVFKALRRRKMLQRILLHAMLFAGLYLGGQPSSSSDETKDEVLGTCYGWQTLNKFIPSTYEDDRGTFRWFWLFWASWMVLVSVKEIPWAKAVFQARFSQYLGKHSFALYLIHGPMIGILGERLFYLTGVKQIDPEDADAVVKFGHLANRWHDAAWWPFPHGGLYGLEPNFLFCQVICVVVFLYVAEISTKMFDTPSVKVARWVYKRLKDTRQ